MFESREWTRNFIIRDEAKFDLWDEINVYCTRLLPKKGGYYFVEKTLDVKIMHAHMSSPFMVESWV